jgi:hypothetical protein
MVSSIVGFARYSLFISAEEDKKKTDKNVQRQKEK